MLTYFADARTLNSRDVPVRPTIRATRKCWWGLPKTSRGWLTKQPTPSRGTMHSVSYRWVMMAVLVLNHLIRLLSLLSFPFASFFLLSKMVSWIQMASLIVIDWLIFLNINYYFFLFWSISIIRDHRTIHHRSDYVEFALVNNPLKQI